METYETQRRITLTKLRVAEFASNESLAFTATVLFDGVPVGQARNDGGGGMTLIHPLAGQRDPLGAATAYAATLPPARLDLPENEPSDPIEVTLDFVVDHLAGEMYFQRKLRAAFNRSMAAKVLLVLDGKLQVVRGVKLNAVADRAALFDKLRARYGPGIVILAELPREEAFAVWKRHVDID